MFATDTDKSYEPPATGELKNYVIKIDDYLDLKVFTQNGEKIIDPDFELAGNIQNTENLRPKIKYRVKENGIVTFPMIGRSI